MGTYVKFHFSLSTLKEVYIYGCIYGSLFLFIYLFCIAPKQIKRESAAETFNKCKEQVSHSRSLSPVLQVLWTCTHHYTENLL